MTEEQKPGQVSMALAGVLITILVIAALMVVFAAIGAMAAVTVESYQWFREAFHWS